jgi:hypothetical protein
VARLPHHYRHCSALPCPHPPFGLRNRSASVDECRRVQFFPHGGIQRRPSASYALTCQAPFCQNPPLLLSESASELYPWSDRRMSAKLVPTYADRGCHVVSVTIPYGRIVGFLYRSSYFFFQVAPKLYTRG